MKKTKTIKASEFKTKCLSILDAVDKYGETITITKRGRPVAYLARARKPKRVKPFGCMKGTFKIVGDIVSPSLAAEEWHAEQGRLV